MFLFYIYFKFYSLSVLCICYSIIHLYSHYELLLQQHFYSCFLLFYINYCLLRMNAFLVLIQQILQLQHLQFHPLFFQFFWRLNQIITEIKHFFIATKVFMKSSVLMSYIKLLASVNNSFDLFSYFILM